MKRACTESERALLYKNRKQVLEGIYQTAAKSSLCRFLVAIFLSVIAMFAGMYVFDSLFHIFNLIIDIVMLICPAFLYTIFFKILNEFRIKRAKRAFLKKDNLMINGATLVKVETENRFLYVEDDFFDAEGKPVLLEYPSRFLEISQEDVGKRFLVLYDDTGSFQLVRLNDELRELVSDFSSFSPLTGDLSEYCRLSHPNMKDIDKEGHELLENEKEEFADLYVNVIQSILFRFSKNFIITMTVLYTIICIILNMLENGVSLKSSLPIEAVGLVGLILIFCFMFVFGKKILKQQGMEFVHVKKVIFHSYIIGSNLIQVYEWHEGQGCLRGYPAGNSVAEDTVYGSVLYKFTKQNGDCVLVNLEPVRQKKEISVL